MTYNEAIAAVESGKYTWWSGLNGGVAGSYIFGSPIKLYGPGSPSGTLYAPTPGDKAATTWAESDRPPH